jgi:hypothetical protein
MFEAKHCCECDSSGHILIAHPSNMSAGEGSVPGEYRIQLIKYGMVCLQEEPDEHGQGKWEGKQEGKSDKRITIYGMVHPSK